MTSIQSPTAEQIETLRDLFFKKIEKDGPPCEGGFHPNDIERAKTSDRWLQLFLEQCDLDMKQSLNMVWETCIWRKTFGTNDLNEKNVRLDYLQSGVIFPHNKDKEGKTLLIFKSKLHTKGSKDVGELIKCLVYWIERLHRKENYNQLSIMFDMQSAGLSNMDMDFTRRIIDTFKLYYPNSLNFIIIFDMPWILNAAFKIIKTLLPPKAVARMKFVNTKNMNEFIDENQMLKNWGGTDNYEFVFEPDTEGTTTTIVTAAADSSQRNVQTTNANTTMVNNSAKKVHFATPSPPESPMSSEIPTSTITDRNDGELLRISPEEAIIFTKSANEFLGTVEIGNISQTNVTYKIKTTSPDKFRVRPSTGILAPGANTTINVVLQQGHQISLLNRDKFLVMCMSLPDNVTTDTQSIADLWKNTPSNSTSVEQHRLRCTFPSGGGSTNGAATSSSSSGDGIKNGQINHFSSSLCQLTETTQRLESQLKFTQTLQWITLIVFLILSIAVVYILKQEIKSQSDDFCTKQSEL